MKSFSSFVCASCRQSRHAQLARAPSSTSRSLSTTRPLFADDSSSKYPFADDPMMGLLNSQASQSTYARQSAAPSRPRTSLGYASTLDEPPPPPSALGAHGILPRHRLHVYSTKHNTHITLTAPVESPTTGKGSSNNAADIYKAPEPNKILISMAAGNIGFRKAGRGTYDAGYQLTAFVLKQVQERGYTRNIDRLEVVLRGYGQGREAFSKALQGQEGRFVRPKITAFVDSTRLKFGGTRSPNRRRLG